MQGSERFLAIKAIITPWRAMPLLPKQGSLSKSFSAVIISGLAFGTVQLLSAYLRGFAISASMARLWYFGGMIACIVGWCILSFFSYVIAVLLMHTKPLEITPFLRASGYAIFPFAFWSIQWAGWLIPLYGVYLWILASKHGFECDYDKAVMISIPVIVAYLFLVMMSPIFPVVPLRPVD